MEDAKFKAAIVLLIANGKVEQALELLARRYGIEVPKIKVGLPKGKRKSFGCYDPRTRVISVLNSDTLKEPFVILHEFYHHVRTGLDSRHKGTEKYADDFAREFVEAYKILASETGE